MHSAHAQELWSGSVELLVGTALAEGQNDLASAYLQTLVPAVIRSRVSCTPPAVEVEGPWELPPQMKELSPSELQVCGV